MPNNLNSRHKRYKEHIKVQSIIKYGEYFGAALIGSIVLCFVLMLLSHLYAQSCFLGAEDNKAAALGDSFGGVNAVISTLAFLGVFLALVMQQKQIELQRKDLALQRKELKNNTKELSLQRKEFEEQNRNIRLQRFENTFFQMLTLHHEIVNGLKIDIYPFDPNFNIPMVDVEPAIITGREVFISLYTKAAIQNSDNVFFRGITDIVDREGMEGYDDTEEITILDHYFRNLYRIFKFIDTVEIRNDDDNDNKGVITEQEQKDYAAIVRANLSEYELVMLFLNCIYMDEINEEPQFKEFANKYHLFNNLRDYRVGKGIFDKIKGRYNDSAFNR